MSVPGEFSMVVPLRFANAVTAVSDENTAQQQSWQRRL